MRIFSVVLIIFIVGLLVWLVWAYNPKLFVFGMFAALFIYWIRFVYKKAMAEV